MSAASEAQEIDLERQVVLFGGNAHSLRLFAVKFRSSLEPENIRVSNVKKFSALNAPDHQRGVRLKILFPGAVLPCHVDRALVVFVAENVLTQDQIFNSRVPEELLRSVKAFRIILDLNSRKQPDLPFKFGFQRFHGLHVAFKLLRSHAKAGIEVSGLLRKYVRAVV